MLCAKLSVISPRHGVSPCSSKMQFNKSNFSTIPLSLKAIYMYTYSRPPPLPANTMDTSQNKDMRDHFISCSENKIMLPFLK